MVTTDYCNVFFLTCCLFRNNCWRMWYHIILE